MYYSVKRFSSLSSLGEINIKARDGSDIKLVRYQSGFSRLLGKVSGRIRNYQEKSPWYEIYVDGERVGDIQPSEKSPGEVNIVWVEIDQKYRGKGYSQSVLEEIIKFAKSSGYKKMTLEVPGISPNARHIYEKLGFKPGKSLKAGIWGDLTEMQLDL